MVKVSYVFCILVILTVCNVALAYPNSVRTAQDVTTSDGLKDGTIKRFCAGYALDGVGLRTMVKRTFNGEECNVDGWSTYMIFYAFDHGYGQDENLCLYGCGESFSRAHRAMITVSKKPGSRDCIDSLWNCDWRDNIFGGAMEDPRYSDPVDVMWAFHGYHRLLLNSLNDQLDYTNLPTLHGWESSGQTLHTLLAVRYNPLLRTDPAYTIKQTMTLNRDNFNYGMFMKDEWKKRFDNKPTKSHGKLMHNLSRLAGMWSVDKIDLPEEPDRLLLIENGESKSIIDQDLPDSRIEIKAEYVTYDSYPGLPFMTIEIKHQDTVYAKLELPYGLNIGHRRIRRALLEALIMAPSNVRVVHRDDVIGINSDTVDWIAITEAGVIPLGHSIVL